MMKAFFFAMVLLVSQSGHAESGSMVGGGDTGLCAKETAVAKARQISDTIATMNSFDLTHVNDPRIKETEDYFFVEWSYDQGLSVPAYTVQVSKWNCIIQDIKHSNHEG